MFDFTHCTGKIAALCIAADHDPSAGVLAIDGVWPGAFADVCDLSQFNLPTFGFVSVMRQVNAKTTEIGIVRPILLFQANEQIKTTLAFEYLRNHLALQSRLQHVGNILSRQSVQSQVVRTQFDMQLSRLANWFDDRRRDARNVLNGAFDLLGHSAQSIEVIAVDLDRDLSVDARNHVADQVGKRLFDFDVHARRFIAELLQQLGQDFLAIGLGIRVHAEDVFAEIHWRRMFVHLGPAGSTNERQNLSVGPFIGLLHRLKDRVDRTRCLVRRIQ